MCRNIRTLYNFDPPASEDEIQAAALQFVRKVSGTSRPSNANAAVIENAVEDIATAVTRLLDELTTSAPAKNREVEAARARERNARRFSNNSSQTDQTLNPALQS
jgi:hypothetical protein